MGRECDRLFIPPCGNKRRKRWYVSIRRAFNAINSDSIEWLGVWFRAYLADFLLKSLNGMPIATNGCQLSALAEQHCVFFAMNAFLRQYAMATIENSYLPKQRHGRLSSTGTVTLPARTRTRVAGIPRFLTTDGSFKIGMRWAMVVIAAVALCLSTYLSWAALTSTTLFGCGSGQILDCNHVFQSKWSMAFGVPVGIPAAGLYLGMLLALLVNLVSERTKLRTVALYVVTAAACAAGLAAIWFISLQLFVVGRLCGYCLAAHACGLFLAGAVLWVMPLGRNRTLMLSAIGFVGVAILATAQLIAEPPRRYTIENHASGALANPQRESHDSTDDPNVFSAPGFESKASGESKLKSETPQAPLEHNSRNGVLSPAVRGVAMFWQAALLRSTSLLIAVSPLNLQDDQTSQAKDESTGSTKPIPTSDSTPPKASDERRLVNVHGGKLRLDIKQWPLVGSPNAKYVIVEVFDYTCPYCRENHKAVSGAMNKLGKDVALLALSVPMNSQCNPTIQTTDAAHADACELSRLSVAVWRVNPNEFGKFHEWLFSGNSTPSAAAAKTYAENLVGKDKLDAELAKKTASEYVAKQVELYQKIGAGTVPKLLFPTTTVTGQVGTTDSLIQIIKQQSTTK